METKKLKIEINIYLKNIFNNIINYEKGNCGKLRRTGMASWGSQNWS